MIRILFDYPINMLFSQTLANSKTWLLIMMIATPLLYIHHSNSCWKSRGPGLRRGKPSRRYKGKKKKTCNILTLNMFHGLTPSAVEFIFYRVRLRLQLWFFKKDFAVILYCAKSLALKQYFLWAMLYHKSVMLPHTQDECFKLNNRIFSTLIHPISLKNNICFFVQQREHLILLLL